MMKLSANLRIANLVSLIYILHTFLYIFFVMVILYIFFANAVTSSNILRAGVWDRSNT